MNPESTAPTPEESYPPSGPAEETRPITPEIITIEERQAGEPPRPPGREPPLHILSALVTVALDWIWFLIELPATLSLAFIPTLLPLTFGLGILDFTAVMLVQRFLANESWGVAAAKGLVMGIVAGVPYPVFGTVIGVPLAAWAGIREVQKLLLPPHNS